MLPAGIPRPSPSIQAVPACTHFMRTCVFPAWFVLTNTPIAHIRTCHEPARSPAGRGTTSALSDANSSKPSAPATVHSAVSTSVPLHADDRKRRTASIAVCVPVARRPGAVGLLLLQSLVSSRVCHLIGAKQERREFAAATERQPWLVPLRSKPRCCCRRQRLHLSLCPPQRR